MEYLKIWTSFAEILEPLNDAERGRLFSAMLQYAAKGTVIEFKGNERYVWPIAKQNLDQAAQKVETLRRNGARGGRPSKAEETSENQTEPDESKENQTKANESLNVNVNVNVKDNDKDKDKDKASTKRTRFSPPTVDEVSEYCKERNNKVDPQTFVDFYAASGWMRGKTPIRDWKACVRTWEQRDDQRGGSVQKPRLLRAQDYEQREYHEEEMQKILGVDDIYVSQEEYFKRHGEYKPWDSEGIPQ
jgi:hypothetical protein